MTSPLPIAAEPARAASTLVQLARFLSLTSLIAAGVFHTRPSNCGVALPNPAFQAKERLFWPVIEQLLELDENEWRRMIHGTAMKRAKIRGLLRNLMVVAGNAGRRELLPKLQPFLKHSDE